MTRQMDKVRTKKKEQKMPVTRQKKRNKINIMNWNQSRGSIKGKQNERRHSISFSVELTVFFFVNFPWLPYYWTRQHRQQQYWAQKQQKLDSNLLCELRVRFMVAAGVKKNRLRMQASFWYFSHVDWATKHCCFLSFSYVSLWSIASSSSESKTKTWIPTTFELIACHRFTCSITIRVVVTTPIVQCMATSHMPSCPYVNVAECVSEHLIFWLHNVQCKSSIRNPPAGYAPKRVCVSQVACWKRLTTRRHNMHEKFR